MPTLNSAIIQAAGFRPGSSGILFQSNNTADIGDSGATGKPRDLWIGRHGRFGDTLTIDGTTYIGDTANAQVTKGLTINQGAADDEILARKSSDVAHGMTSRTEADTYSYDKKYSATEGGHSLAGFSEGVVGVHLWGNGTTSDTTKSTSGIGHIVLQASKASGTFSSNSDADANLVVVQDHGNTRFILDLEGTGHADVAWTTF